MTNEILFQKMKEKKIDEGREILERYIVKYPMYFIDGKLYSVTPESREDLRELVDRSKLAEDYYVFNWKTDDGEVVIWDYANLKLLLKAIDRYVEPFYTKQELFEADVESTKSKVHLSRLVSIYWKGME